MEGRTIQKQISSIRFIPKNKRAIILAQKDYSAVWTVDPETKKVRQFYPDLPAVDQDKLMAFEMCQFLNIKDFGLNDLYILNKDLEKDSVTLIDLNQIFKDIIKEHRRSPDSQ